VRLLKWISWGLAAFVVLILLGVGVVAWVVDPNAFKARIEKTVREATGREFTLVGDIELNFFPWLALRTGAGQFGNPPGFPAEPMASWQHARLGVRLFPLMRGELVVDRITLENTDVRLTRRADGKANWEGIGGEQAADPQARRRHITIDGVDLRDSRLLFVDEAAARRVEITALNLTTRTIDPGKPFTGTTIAGVAHMPGFAPAGVPFRVEVPEAALTEDYSKLDVPGFSVRLGDMESDGTIRGTFGEVTRLEGNIDTNTFDARALLASLGIEAPKTTDPATLTRVDLESAWKFDAGAISVDPLDLQLDDTHFAGHFHRGAGDDPVGEFALQGDHLDIARYIPVSDPASPPFVLPTAELRALKFRGVLELAQATYEDVEMKGVTLRLLLDEQGLRSQPPPKTAGTP